MYISKNSIPQAKPKNPPNTDVPTPPTEDKITISKTDDYSRKVESKEDSSEEVLSESNFMDTSPADVVLHPSSPVNKTRSNSEISEIVNKLTIPHVISPLNSPDKTSERTEEEEILLSFCAINENEATKLSRRSFPQSEFITVSDKYPNHFFFTSKLSPSDIPQVKSCPVQNTFPKQEI